MEYRQAGLIDDLGNFEDPFKLVDFFCQKTPSKPKVKKGKQA
jgi:hypothetical protein